METKDNSSKNQQIPKKSEETQNKKQAEESSSSSFFKRFGQLLLIIAAGTGAYGLGLYRGHQYRMSQELAAQNTMEAARGSGLSEASFVGPKLPSSSFREPANTRGNTQDLKSHSK